VICFEQAVPGPGWAGPARCRNAQHDRERSNPPQDRALLNKPSGGALHGVAFFGARPHYASGRTSHAEGPSPPRQRSACALQQHRGGAAHQSTLVQPLIVGIFFRCQFSDILRAFARSLQLLRHQRQR
jgi:hypothetical protein